MSSAALRAKALLEQVVAPHVRPGDRISRQKRLAFDLLRMEEVPAGWSKIEAAWKGRAGPPTLVVIEDQAEKYGHLKRNRCEAPADDATRNLQQLRLARDRLCAVDPDFGAEYAQAINWAIRHLGTSE